MPSRHSPAVLLRPVVLALLAGSMTVPALQAQSDTASTGGGAQLFTLNDALLAGGILGLARLVQPLDAHYQRRLRDSSTQANRKLQVLSKVVRNTAAPGAFIIGGTLYAGGRLAGNRKMASLGLHGTEALLVGEMTAVVLKGMIGRARPYAGKGPNDYQFLRGFREGDRYKSFPSGHTVAAFAAAAAVTSETNRNAPNTTWIVGPLLYGGAALAGVSRMYDDRHWASDVIVGAGIGTLAGLKVVRFHDANPRRGLDGWLLAGSLVPTSDGGRTVRWSVLPASVLRRHVR